MKSLFQYVMAGPPFSAKKLASSPWNEIDLFHSILRFRNPKPTKLLSYNSPFRYTGKYHCRFVDTFTKKDYVDVVNGNRSVCFVYNTAWVFKPNRWLNKNPVVVDLSINIFALLSQDMEEGRDLRSSEELSVWVQAAHQKRKALFNQVDCTKHDDGMMSVEFNDQVRLPTQSMAELSSVQSIDVNGRHWLQIHEPNQVFFYTAIAKEDALCFSFMTYSDEAFGKPFNVSPEMQQQIMAFMLAIIDSVKLTPSTRMDAFIKGKHISGQR